MELDPISDRHTNVTIVGFDPNRKIAAIKYLRAIGNSRGPTGAGEPGLRQAKNAIDALADEGRFIVVENVPNQVLALAQGAARDAGIRLLNDVHHPKTWI